MKIFRNKIELDNHLGEIRKKGREIGLIPTMGSIHKGHKSLVEKCIDANFFSLATIYINPTQFNNHTDLSNYPKAIKNDITLLEKANCNIVYIIYFIGINNKCRFIIYKFKRSYVII